MPPRALLAWPAQQGIRQIGADDMYFTHAAFEGALGSFELEHHTAGNDAGLHETLDFFPSYRGKHLVPIEDAGNIGEIDQTVGAEVFGTGCRHVVGIDVVQLIVRSQAEAGGDGNKVFAPEGLDEGIVQSSEIADETETALDFVVNHGFGTEAGGIRSGNPDGGCALGGNGGGETLVQEACENHHRYGAQARSCQARPRRRRA